MNQNPVPTKLKTSSHLISLPHPTCPHFVVQITELRDSLSVWCGLAPSWLVDRQRKRRGLAGMNDEEQEEEEEDELVKALKESGRLAQPLQSDPVEDQRRPPIGSVAVEWAVAMTYRTPPSTLEKNSNTIATSLFRTNSDVALPMSQRLARALSLPQILLSLDLPPQLRPPSSSVPQDPQDSLALLALEKGLRDACRSVLST